MNIYSPHLLTLHEAGLIIVCLLGATRRLLRGCVRRSSHRGTRLLSTLFSLSEKMVKRPVRRQNHKCDTCFVNCAAVQMWIGYGVCSRLVTFSRAFSISVIHCSFEPRSEWNSSVKVPIAGLFLPHWGKSRILAFKSEKMLIHSACSCQSTTVGNIFSFLLCEYTFSCLRSCLGVQFESVMQVFQSCDSESVPVNLIQSSVGPLIYWAGLVSTEQPCFPLHSNHLLYSRPVFHFSGKEWCNETSYVLIWCLFDLIVLWCQKL